MPVAKSPLRRAYEARLARACQLGLVARSPAPAYGLTTVLRGALRPDEPPDAGGRSTIARRSVSDGSLRQGRQGDTMEALAPDAAALRSRHVARRMGSTIIPLLRFVLDVT
jgi:hypothetical protein